MKKICLFAILISIFNIGVVKALSMDDAQKIELENNCEVGNCVLDNDDFTFDIKEITLVDKQNQKIADLDEWTINPEFYKGNENDSIGMALNLNLEVPGLKDIIKNHSTNFEGYINIKYELNLKNRRTYTYKMDSFMELFTMLAANNFDSLLVNNMPVSGSFNYSIVTLKDDKLEIVGDKDTSTEDTLSFDIAMLMVISTDQKLTVTTSEESSDIPVTALIVTSEDLTEENLDNVEDYINKESENDDIKIDDTSNQEQSQDEKSNEPSPDTNVVSNIILLVLGMGGIILFIYTNNKIIKRKI